MNTKIILALAILPSLACAEEAGRWLPKGEIPQVIERVYSSPAGDLEFLKQGEKRSAFLRSARGSLASFERLSGGPACEAWFLSDKSSALPRGCEFQFSGASVRSEEMEESNLFQAVSGSVRGKNVAL